MTQLKIKITRIKMRNGKRERNDSPYNHTNE